MFTRLRQRHWLRTIRANGFWFVDIPRTSSTSIRVELSRRYGRAYEKSNVLLPSGQTITSRRQLLPEEWRPGDHVTAQQMQRLLGKQAWKEIFSFSLVRNPWERMASLFFYRKKRGSIPENISFRDYILQFRSPRYTQKKSLHSRPAYYYGAAEYICNGEGKIMVDLVGRYEQREDFIAELSSRLSIPDLGKTFLQQAKPSDLHYSTLYDKETELVVGQVFSLDVELFGYRFERKR